MGHPATDSTGAGDRSTACLRIGFFVPWITLGRGGTENVGHMMANAMAARGHHVVVFTFDDARNAPCWPLDDRIELAYLTQAEDEPADHQMALEVGVRNLDLLVGLHMNRTFTRYLRCAYRTGRPIVLSEHIDPRFPDWLGAFPPEERVITFSGATRIHMLVDAFRATLPDDLQDRICVVPNTIREPDILADLNAQKNSRTILTMSRLVPRKNVERLVDAFGALARSFPNWNLKIVGDGPSMAGLKAQAKSLGLGRRVHFTGEVTDPYPEYLDADLYVTPALFEGFGLTVCEANAHGIPAIGYAICNGINEQIIPGENGLLASGGDDMGSLVEDMRRLMTDDALRVKMGARARELFLSRYANDVVFSAWEQMFQDAAQAPLNRTPPSQDALRSVRLWESMHGPMTVEMPTKRKF